MDLMVALLVLGECYTPAPRWEGLDVSGSWQLDCTTSVTLVQLSLHSECSQADLDFSLLPQSPLVVTLPQLLRQHLSQRSSGRAHNVLHQTPPFRPNPHTLILKQLFRNITYQQSVFKPKRRHEKKTLCKRSAQSSQNLETERQPQSRAPLFTLPSVGDCPCVHIPAGEFVERVRGQCRICPSLLARKATLLSRRGVDGRLSAAHHHGGYHDGSHAPSSPTAVHRPPSPSIFLFPLQRRLLSLLFSSLSTANFFLTNTLQWPHSL